jgi:hypothetical protein
LPVHMIEHFLPVLFAESQLPVHNYCMKIANPQQRMMITIGPSTARRAG